MHSPHLHRKLQESLGDDAGEELGALIDRIDPIRGDIAELRHSVRSDIAALQHSVRSDIAALQHSVRSDMAELQHSVLAAVADVRHEMRQGFEKSAKEQIRFLFLAWAVLLAAIVGLYGR